MRRCAMCSLIVVCTMTAHAPQPRVKRVCAAMQSPPRVDTCACMGCRPWYDQHTTACIIHDCKTADASRCLRVPVENIQELYGAHSDCVLYTVTGASNCVHDTVTVHHAQLLYDFGMNAQAS